MRVQLLFFCLLLVPPVVAQIEQVDYIEAGDTWRYFKGTAAPPASWNTVGFNDGSWLQGPTGIGYGDGDDATELTDMRDSYLSVFMRRTFMVAEPQLVVSLGLDLTYDDGFAAYLNGVEVWRENLTSGAAYDTAANDAIEPTPALKDLGGFLALLQSGVNVLAIEVHNAGLTSSDLSMIPALAGQVMTNAVPFTRGDANSDGKVDVGDAVFILAYLFEDGPASTCPDSEDIDDSGRLNLIDPVYLLANLFIGGPAIPEPRDCGYDFTTEGEQTVLAECEYPLCP